ncbi:hypothetical protein BDY24DRAFT_376856 [Mrakia frigida]|uniref:uncharacterized protein n=1 Tax=Mrakia frigida TaxID=29902 RepID=UPI003FCC0404
MDASSAAGPSASSSHQPIASGSTPPRRAPSPPPPAVLPFAPPPLPKTHLTGSLDLLSHLSLLPSYDAYVRPYFRNPKAPVPLAPGTGTVGGLAALTAEDKGKGRAVEGEGGKTKGRPVQQQTKKIKDNVVDLKRMKADFDDLVEECVVLASDHPSIHHPPASFRRLVYEAPDEGSVPNWAESLRVYQPEQLEEWGWRLSEGRLPELDDMSLFVRTPRIQGDKKKKKNKRPRPSEDPLNPAPNANTNTNTNGGNAQFINVSSDPNKRRKENGGALTPRTPGINVGTPGGGSGSGGGGGGRTPRG